MTRKGHAAASGSPLASSASDAEGILPSSFRDPSGFLFRHNGVLYRQVNHSYAKSFDQLTDSGLYDALVEDGLLIPHEEVDTGLAVTGDACKVIRPRLVPFISYPYEWSFSQLKDAALLTLEIQKRALEHGMSLKDASAYNVQFVDGRPVLIDTLSFEPYPEGQPWVAYGQFCRHFLAPLALMSRTDIRLSQLLRVYIDGIPLDLASSLLPRGTRWNISLGMHLHMHARAQQKYAGEEKAKSQIKRAFSKKAFTNLLESLRATVAKVNWKPGGTEWHDYYEANNNYGEKGLKEKEQLVSRFLEKTRPETVWDLGANTGRFSRIAGEGGAQVVSWDIDPACVETNYQMTRKHNETGILPLLLDLTNPSPDLGWHGGERDSFARRGPVDTVMALGLIHHLAISNNVPLNLIAEFFRATCQHLIIEFIPKEDSQVKKLLSTREDVFSDYTREGFEAAFKPYFSFDDVAPIPGTSRTLFLMQSQNK